MSRPKSGLARAGVLSQPLALAAIALILGAFLFAALNNLARPGMNYDEALQAPAALRVLNPQAHREISIFAPALRLGGREWPVMSLQYIGAVKSYLLAGAFAVAGVNLSTTRAIAILLTAAGLLFTYLFVRRGWGATCALITTALVATDPAFVMLHRVDYGPVAIAFLCRAAALYAFLRYHKSRHLGWLAGAGLLLGLGVYDKVSFAWFVAALAVVVIVARAVGLLRFSGRELLILALAAIGGSLPWWFWNLAAGWPMLRTAATGNLPELARGQPLPVVLLNVLPSRLNALHDMLSGHGVDQMIFGAPVEPWIAGYRDTLQPSGLAICAALALAALLTPARQRIAWRLVLFPIGMCGLLLAQMLSMPLTISYHHLINLYPFPQLLIAAVVSQAAAITGSPPLKRAIVATAVIIASAILVSNLLVTRQYHALLRANGGRGDWSPAIYAVNDIMLSRYPEQTIAVLDWGASTQLVVLSGGKLRTGDIELWQSGDDPDLLVNAVMNYPNVVFLMRAPGREHFPAATEAFRRALQLKGIAPCDEEIVREVNGDPLYVIDRVSGCGADGAAVLP